MADNIEEIEPFCLRVKGGVARIRYTIENTVGSPNRSAHYYSMGCGKNIFRENYWCKSENYPFVVSNAVGYRKEIFHFRPSHTTQWYFYTTSLDKKLSFLEEKQISMLRMCSDSY